MINTSTSVLLVQPRFGPSFSTELPAAGAWTDSLCSSKINFPEKDPRPDAFWVTWGNVGSEYDVPSKIGQCTSPSLSIPLNALGPWRY